MQALVRMEPDIEVTLRPGWHVRLARAADRLYGPGCSIAGMPAGLHFLLGGQYGEAERSLQETLRHNPLDARARGYYADALFHLEQLDRSRTEYLRAFLCDRGTVDLDWLRS